MHPKKAIGQHAAVEESSQFSFHKRRDCAITFSLPGKEYFKVSRNNAVVMAVSAAACLLPIAKTALYGCAANKQNDSLCWQGKCPD
jgi:hypothetical protein